MSFYEQIAQQIVAQAAHDGVDVVDVLIPLQEAVTRAAAPKTNTITSQKAVQAVTAALANHVTWPGHDGDTIQPGVVYTGFLEKWGECDGRPGVWIQNVRTASGEDYDGKIHIPIAVLGTRNWPWPVCDDDLIRMVPSQDNGLVTVIFGWDHPTEDSTWDRLPIFLRITPI